MIRSASLSRLFLPLAGVLVTVALATGGAQSAATRIAPLHGDVAAMPDAAAMFADAPDGVDPVVTGPVSASFRQQQAEAGCDKAVWPKIPAACYPN
ncbi:hypothetical protein [Aquamicrobium soli]|jgi:hypothetical protein|uniref:Uncharacterized protein n=1 Tax=Aquamicrobium soli TaxID=1811518 RepID=A0ABV7KD92_9HYPH